MRVSLFDFDLPPERIAHHPVTPRDAAKLLLVRNKVEPEYLQKPFEDRHVRDLPQLLEPASLLVFNNSKVIPARLFAPMKTGKPVEILLHQKQQDESWLAFAKPARKLKVGMQLTFAENFSAQVEGRTEDGQVILRFAGKGLFNQLRRHGHIPLPPYIARADEAADQQDYQTVYAKHDGSVAAPTAGLHFTTEMMGSLAGKALQSAFVTLHVGAGTFQPVKVADTTEHQMHREWIEISADAAERINRARANGYKIVAVGTTSLRILESVADENGMVRPYSGYTHIFITPGYKFKIVDCLVTNFHLPKSTLFMLVSAFAGLERMQAAYAHAIAKDYRFYSYGDASLLERSA